MLAAALEDVTNQLQSLTNEEFIAVSNFLFVILIDFFMNIAIAERFISLDQEDS